MLLSARSASLASATLLRARRSRDVINAFRNEVTLYLRHRRNIVVRSTYRLHEVQHRLRHRRNIICLQTNKKRPKDSSFRSLWIRGSRALLAAEAEVRSFLAGAPAAPAAAGEEQIDPQDGLDVASAALIAAAAE